AHSGSVSLRPIRTSSAVRASCSRSFWPPVGVAKVESAYLCGPLEESFIFCIAHLGLIFPFVASLVEGASHLMSTIASSGKKVMKKGPAEDQRRASVDSRYS